VPGRPRNAVRRQAITISTTVPQHVAEWLKSGGTDNPSRVAREVLRACAEAAGYLPMSGKYDVERVKIPEIPAIRRKPRPFELGYKMS